MKKKTYNVKERYQGMTFAQASKKISDKYKDRDVNPMAKRSFMVEMEELVQLQELARAKEFAVNNAQQEQMLQQKFGGLLKYQMGTSAQGLPDINKVNPLIGIPTALPTAPLPFQTGPQLNRSVAPLEQLPTRMGLGRGFYRGIDPDGPRLEIMGESPYVKSITPQPKIQGPQAAQSNAQQKSRSSSIFDSLIIGKGAELLGKSIMALSGTDRVQPEMNPYAGEAREQLASMRTDMGAVSQRLQGEAARGRTMASNLLSEPIRQAMYQNVASGAMQGLSEAELQGQQMENQYRMARASGLQALGSEAIRSRQYAEQLNTQAKATTQLGLQSILESVGNVGQQVTNYKANAAQQQILANALRTADFKFGNAIEMLNKAVQNKELTQDDFFEIINTAGGKGDEITRLMNERLAKINR
jgi:hypothetical protein